MRGRLTALPLRAPDEPGYGETGEEYTRWHINSEGVLFVALADVESYLHRYERAFVEQLLKADRKNGTSRNSRAAASVSVLREGIDKYFDWIRKVATG